MLKLDGDLAQIERDGERRRCGAGVRLSSAAARWAARAQPSELDAGDAG